MLVVNTASIITATVFSLYLVQGLSLYWHLGVLLSLLLVIMIFSVVLPKAMVARNPAKAGQLLAGPMLWITRLHSPLVSLLGFITSPVVKLLSGQDNSRVPLVTEEELLLMVNVGEEEGLIEADERQMIEGIITFGNTVVSEVMIPRVDIVTLESTTTIDEALNVAIAHGHSRIPVYQDDIDNIVGVLYVKDLLPHLRAGRNKQTIANILRKPYFVPETMKIDALFKELQARKVHLAVAVDEYGGTAGLLTIEDLLEEIVGEIQDEYDAEDPTIEFVGTNEIMVDARMLIDDFNDLTDLNIESEEADRMGGLIYEELGRVPSVGDQISLNDQITITVLSIEGLRPRKLRVNYQPKHLAGFEETEQEAVMYEHTA